jgi:hypothetical protein
MPRVGTMALILSRLEELPYMPQRLARLFLVAGDLVDMAGL